MTIRNMPSLEAVLEIIRQHETPRGMDATMPRQSARTLPVCESASIVRPAPKTKE